ncbi:RNA polymerase sigma factor [Sphingobacterium bambusae]|uniref:RNA polymerase sigma factor n=1 Tax=Sphingobacterium bambusae TaxID=662858 RepID=A0ABW6BBC8_9SPHI|nr:RNA polymerase sigma-70 factor [Sphingobacterium bambusae]WPL47013.1 RNA polymerase sigma-70 factor [Sphingobacterium bambusae]
MTQRYGDYPDETLIGLLKTDDRRAFQELYERYWEKLFFTAARTLGNPEEAEECVQDIFCNLWLRRESLLLKHSFHTYLSVATKYKVIDKLQQRHRNRVALAEAVIYLSTTEPSVETHILEKELMERLTASITALPEKCRLVYQLSREQYKTHKEIALELGISEKTVNNHLVKALRDIKNALVGTIPLL